jgi:hypothetical protein
VSQIDVHRTQGSSGCAICVRSFEFSVMSTFITKTKIFCIKCLVSGVATEVALAFYVLTIAF